MSVSDKHQFRPKVLVIANRLPLTVCFKEGSTSDYTINQSSGGLVSALKGINKLDCTWLGWPGTNISDTMQPKIIEECHARNCEPVFLPEEIADDYYNGYCNGIIWPVLHYVFNPPLEDTNHLYACYERANMCFAETVADYVNSLSQNDQDSLVLWVHDYHLMLLPQYIRRLLPEHNLKIGFFLHTPFPHKVAWSMIARKKELLTGLMHCNTLTFHIYEYQKHFMNTCAKELRLPVYDVTIDATTICGLEIRCSSNPIGIEPQQFINLSLTDEIKLARRNLQRRYNNRKIILGVDRLDYMKGVFQKLKGIQRFVNKYPEMRDDVVFIQLAVPSRENVAAYKKLKSTVHELVARINGTSTSFPYVEHWDQSLNMKQLVAVYAASDVCLISSVRDGMNLVAYEYVSCQCEFNGVLVLSEFAGAERSLAHGVITFNPWSPDQIADAIHDGLTASATERKKKHRWSMAHILEHTAEHWAHSLINELVS